MRPWIWSSWVHRSSPPLNRIEARVSPSSRLRNCLQVSKKLPATLLLSGEQRCVSSSRPLTVSPVGEANPFPPQFRQETPHSPSSGCCYFSGHISTFPAILASPPSISCEYRSCCRNSLCTDDHQDQLPATTLPSGKLSPFFLLLPRCVGTH